MFTMCQFQLPWAAGNQINCGPSKKPWGRLKSWALGLSPNQDQMPRRHARTQDQRPSGCLSKIQVKTRSIEWFPFPRWAGKKLITTCHLKTPVNSTCTEVQSTHDCNWSSQRTCPENDTQGHPIQTRCSTASTTPGLGQYRQTCAHKPVYNTTVR